MEAPAQNKPAAAKRMTTILSIDGGGIRGVIPACILQFLEQQLQALDGPHVRIAHYFDVIAGTSTGGLIGGILVAPNEEGNPRFEAKDVINFYIEEGPKIFKRRGIPVVSQLLGSKHISNDLETILKENLNDLKMKDTIRELFVPAFDIKEMQPVYFSTSEAKEDESKDAYVRDVLRGTSAAPTYFPPYFFDIKTSSGESKDYHLVDGGVGINNPAHLAILHTLRHRSKEKYIQQGSTPDIDMEDYRSLLVLSLGTGKVVQTYDAKDAAKWGALSWLVKDGHAPIIEIVTECSADLADYNLSMLFDMLHCRPHYLRIQAFDLDKSVGSLDDATSENIQNLMDIGGKLLESTVAGVNVESGQAVLEPDQGTNKEALIRFAGKLSEEYRKRRHSS